MKQTKKSQPAHRKPTRSKPTPQAKPHKKPQVKEIWISVKKVKDQQEEMMKKITEKYQADIDRLGKSYAKRWNEVTRISPKDAWYKVHDTIKKIMRAEIEKDENANIDTSALDVFIPAMTRIITERSSEHKMELTVNLFAKYMASDGKLYHNWDLDRDTYSIAIWSQIAPYTQTIPLNRKEQKPVFKSMRFILSEENFLELFEAMTPYM